MTRSRLQHPVIRQINFLWQAVLVGILVGVFWIMPLRMASYVGGFLARNIGPHLGYSRRAWKNITHAMPEKTDAEKKKIIRDMWDNLGRVVGESTHLKNIMDGDYIDVSGFDVIEKARAQGRPVMAVSGHFANWEISPIEFAKRGIDVAGIYRPPNNPYVAAMVRWMRGGLSSTIFAKGKNGARGMMRWLRDGRAVGLLVDQKMNEGIAVPFFGHDVMTAHAPAQMAVMTNAAIIPVLNIRLPNNRFKVIFLPELTSDETKPNETRVYELTLKMNQFLEKHIREYPGQWLWLHRRWPNIPTPHDTTHDTEEK